jgi:hypothetical protein
VVSLQPQYTPPRDRIGHYDRITSVFALLPVFSHRQLYSILDIAWQATQYYLSIWYIDGNTDYVQKPIAKTLVESEVKA